MDSRERFTWNDSEYRVQSNEKLIRRTYRNVVWKFSDENMCCTLFFTFINYSISCLKRFIKIINVFRFLIWRFQRKTYFLLRIKRIRFSTIRGIQIIIKFTKKYYYYPLHHTLIIRNIIYHYDCSLFCFIPFIFHIVYPRSGISFSICDIS